MIEAILPAAGLASRMRGLPKFLLPCDSKYTTLIENHVFGLQNHVDQITIALRHDFVHLLDSLDFENSKVRILAVNESSTMTETVQFAASQSAAEQFVVVMPDTYFYGDQPYEQLSEALGTLAMRLAVWKIREDQKGKLGQIELDPVSRVVTASQDKNPSCDFNWSWGAMTFNRAVLDVSQASMPHTGYLINELLQCGETVGAFEVVGDYYDCGTPKEYFDLIDRVHDTSTHH